MFSATSSDDLLCVRGWIHEYIDRSRWGLLIAKIIGLSAHSHHVIKIQYNIYMVRAAHN